MNSKSVQIGLLILRIVLGVTFIAHGGQKVFGWWQGPGLSGFVSHLHQSGIPVPLAYLAAFTEFGGGLAVLIGLLTRLAALGLCCVMTVAIYQVHWVHGFFMNGAKGQGFEYPLALLAMALGLVFTGAGVLSIDHLLTRKRANL